MTLPDPTCEVEHGVIDRDGIFWDLLEELHRAEFAGRLDTPGRERRSGTLMRRQRPGVNVRRLLRGIPGDTDRNEPFSPTVGCLAGMVWERTGLLPDTAAINLYRDGDDWLAGHHDYEAYFGPTPEDVRIVIFSFGATRAMHLWPVDAERDASGTIVEPPHREIALPHGSMLTMSGTMQRGWLHGIPKAQVRHPRLSVSLLYDQSRQEDCAWRLCRYFTTNAGDDDLAPIRVASKGECIDLWHSLLEHDETPGDDGVPPLPPIDGSFRLQRPEGQFYFSPHDPDLIDE